MNVTRPIAIIVRDGWGTNPHAEWDNANAVKLALHPVDDRLMRDYPHTLIHTSGFDVGLPEGTMGNSEVGHQNIGAGRIVNQESVAITKEIRSGEFFSNVELNAAVDSAMSKNGSVHILGIVSDAGVHGQLEHLFACLDLCKKKGATKVFVHAFTDGRDTSPHSGRMYVKQVEDHLKHIGIGKIASVSGRYYAMDRDDRWPRVEKAYRAIAFGEGVQHASAAEAVQAYYDKPSDAGMKGDEFVTPSVMVGPDHQPLARVADGDAIIFYNYRGDRPRELTKAFVLPQFTGFDRGPKLDVQFVTLTQYETGLPVHVAFKKPGKMANILADYVSQKGLKQFRCAETEKFPHVTFFFNDYREEPFPGEERAIVPSKKLLPDGSPLMTYDQFPEMSAPGIRDEVLKRIEAGQTDLIVVNFANGDMVGHTGNLAAATRACEIVDECVGSILDALAKKGGGAIVTADHGNAEQMIDPATGGPHTAHTTYDVAVIVVDERYKGRTLRAGGRLADIAPTVLEMMALAKPGEMTGESLLT